MSDILATARRRHTAKAYDPARRISDADMETLENLLRFSPSSTNLQPWHFIVAGTAEGKERVAKAAQERFAFNAKAIRDASHVVVFASLIDASAEHIARITAQEEADGRFAADPEGMKARANGGRITFSGIHKFDTRDQQHWLDKQVYLNLGQFLLGAATLGIDATPMEGIDTRLLDIEFGLRDKGFTSLFVVALGYADKDADYNGRLPKSRLPIETIITRV
nr:MULTISPECIES: oxygen-insensitive NAD(P)H nitroreductase [unclassified Novosphingobium]